MILINVPLPPLRFKNFDVKVIQILGETELDPFKKIKRGKIVDVETREKKTVTFSEKNRRLYKDFLSKHNQQLRQFCRTNKIVYSLAKTNMEFEDFILRELPKIGFIR